MNKESKTAYNPEDVVKISEVLARLGIELNDTNRVAFNHAVEREELKKARPDRIIWLRWGDVLDYLEKGTHHQRRRKSGPRKPKDDFHPVASDEETSIIAPCEVLLPDEATSVDSCRHESGESDATALVTEIAEVESRVKTLAGLSTGEVEEVAVYFVGRASGHAVAIRAKGKRLIVAAWASGTFLNQIKGGFRHGAFGGWLEAFGETHGVGVRTLQRFMKLAKLSPDIRLLLEGHGNLKKAYVALGLAGAQPDAPPALDDAPNGGDGSGDAGQAKAASKVASALDYASKFQKSLRQLVQSEETIGEDDLQQLKLVAAQLADFIATLETSNPSNQDAA